MSKEKKASSRKRKNDRYSKSTERINAILSGEEEMDFYTEEAFNLLRTNITLSFTDSDSAKIIGITSSMKGEGKSFVSCCIAHSIAKTGKRVLLIDCDLRLPTVSKKLKLSNTKGLSNLLIGSDNDIAKLVNFNVFGGVNVLTSGVVPPNPSELLGSERMAELLSLLSEKYDYIILDLPPITVVTDALIISKYIHGLLLVVKHEHTDKAALADAIRQAKMVGAKILGFVYNGKFASGGTYKSRYYKSKYYKYGYGYGYGYGYYKHHHSGSESDE